MIVENDLFMIRDYDIWTISPLTDSIVVENDLFMIRDYDLLVD